MAIRTANAEWQGDLTGGKGTFSGGSGYLSGNYSFKSRFPEDTEGGTNPEELIGAAQACCYSMQLSAMLANAGNTPESVKTEARVQLLKQGEGFGITRIEIVTVGRVPGLDQAGFEQAAEAAKEACLITKALSAIPEITLEARLES
jgi:osmotically inducible protein OsmC